jgi:uncharacterized protein
MNIHAMRLHPHQDLQAELDNWAQEQAIEAACVLTCVGSLRQATLRFADQPGGTTLHGKFEIVSLTGTLSRYGSHYHISIADGNGRCYGGHLLPGCPIYTTAEIVLAILPHHRFLRQHDSNTGYDELTIHPTN